MTARSRRSTRTRPRDALSRVETLVLTGGVELPLKAIREQIASAFDMVVQVSRLVDGTRRITHVTEVLRMESDVVTLQDLFIAKPIEDGDEVAAGSAQPPARPDEGHRHQAAVPQQAERERRAPAAAVLPARARPRRDRSPAPDRLRQGLGMRRALVLVAGLAAVLAVAAGTSGAAHATPSGSRRSTRRAIRSSPRS